MRHTTVHRAAANREPVPAGSTAISPMAACASRNTWTRAGRRFYRVTSTPELVTCKAVPEGAEVTRAELERRIAGIQSRLGWANGEYAEQLEQDLKYYQGLLARIPKED